ncbi:MAG: TOMM precursor leader peptide-binding protein [Nocardioides sp.]
MTRYHDPAHRPAYDQARRPVPDGPPHLLVLAAGDFGLQVARALAEHHDTTVLTIDDGTHPSLWPFADVIVLAADHERPAVVDAVDATAFVRGIPWVAAHTRPTELQVGPVVVPGRGPCYRCFGRRRAQHGPAQTPIEVPPPRGFARHHVALAVALTRVALAEALPVHPTEDGRPSGERWVHAEPGTRGTLVRRLHLVTGALSCHEVVAVDGCDRCRGRFGPRDQGRQELWSTLDRAASERTQAGMELVR